MHKPSVFWIILLAVSFLPGKGFADRAKLNLRHHIFLVPYDSEKRDAVVSVESRVYFVHCRGEGYDFYSDCWENSVNARDYTEVGGREYFVRMANALLVTPLLPRWERSGLLKHEIARKTEKSEETTDADVKEALIQEVAVMQTEVDALETQLDKYRKNLELYSRIVRHLGGRAFDRELTQEEREKKWVIDEAETLGSYGIVGVDPKMKLFAVIKAPERCATDTSVVTSERFFLQNPGGDYPLAGIASQYSPNHYAQTRWLNKGGMIFDYFRPEFGIVKNASISDFIPSGSSKSMVEIEKDSFLIVGEVEKVGGVLAISWDKPEGLANIKIPRFKYTGLPTFRTVLKTAAGTLLLTAAGKDGVWLVEMDSTGVQKTLRREKISEAAWDGAEIERVVTVPSLDGGAFLAVTTKHHPDDYEPWKKRFHTRMVRLDANWSVISVRNSKQYESYEVWDGVALPNGKIGLVGKSSRSLRFRDGEVEGRGGKAWVQVLDSNAEEINLWEWDHNGAECSRYSNNYSNGCRICGELDSGFDFSRNGAELAQLQFDFTTGEMALMLSRFPSSRGSIMRFTHQGIYLGASSLPETHQCEIQPHRPIFPRYFAPVPHSNKYFVGSITQRTEKVQVPDNGNYSSRSFSSMGPAYQLVPSPGFLLMDVKVPHK